MGNDTISVHLDFYVPIKCQRPACGLVLGYDRGGCLELNGNATVRTKIDLVCACGWRKRWRPG